LGGRRPSRRESDEEKNNKKKKKKNTHISTVTKKRSLEFADGEREGSLTKRDCQTRTHTLQVKEGEAPRQKAALKEVGGLRGELLAGQRRQDPRQEGKLTQNQQLECSPGGKRNIHLGRRVKQGDDTEVGAGKEGPEREKAKKHITPETPNKRRGPKKKRPERKKQTSDRK